jgi:hypothetical protein
VVEALGNIKEFEYMPIMSKEEFDTLFAQANPAQCPIEVWWLVQKLNDLQPSKCLEIGGGATQYFWGFFAPTISLTMGNHAFSYDDQGKIIEHVSAEFKGFEECFDYIGNPLYNGVRTFTCDSHEPSTLASVAELGPYDFVFIDGDHRRTGVQMDIEMYFPLINKGGLAAFHDWNHQGSYPPDGVCYPVQKAFSNLGISPTDVKIGEVHGYGIATVQL